MQNKKWLSLLIALVVALGLWVYVVAVENPEGTMTFHNIPVVFSGEDVLREDYDLIITDDNVASGVSVTFSGRLTDLNKLSDKESDLVVTIDVTRNVRSAREYNLNYDLSNITLPSSVSSSSFEVTSISPNTINLTVEKLARRTIDVEVVAEIATADGYMADLPEQDYTQIVIEGPEDVIAQVKYALVQLKRENVDRTITATMDYTLMSVDGEPMENDAITADIEQIEVTIPVRMVKDVPLEIGVIEGGGATEADVSVEISPSTIRLSGESSVLDAVQSIKLSSIDLSALTSNEGTLTRTIPIPEGCISVSGETEVQVTIRIRNKSIKALRVTTDNITCINAPEGVQVDIKTTTMLIYIRANTSDIDDISPENVRVVADLSTVGVLEGSVSVPVQIYVDGFEGAGVISEKTPSINLDLSAIEEE